MACKYQKKIYRLVDGELKGADQAQLQKHVEGCLICQKEAGAIQKLTAIIKTSAVSVEPSLNFDGIFWQKVMGREKESWFAKALRHLESLIPAPNFAQAFAILLIALVIGGTGGAVSAMNALTPERLQSGRASIQYLSGFREFKGIPSSSVSAAYLRTTEERAS
jgi:hypothetical protein